MNPPHGPSLEPFVEHRELRKDRSASKPSIGFRKSRNRARNKMARKTKQQNRK